MRKNFTKNLSLLAAIAVSAMSMSMTAAAAPLPLPAHFVPEESDIEGCVLLPVTEYDPDWEFGNYWIDGEETNAFGCYENYNEKADSWLILPQLKTDAGGTFNISYSHMTRNYTPVSYTICWGLEPTAEAMTNVIYTADNYSGSGAPEAVSKDFEIPAGQNIYIAYHLTTERGCGGVNLKVFDIKISGGDAPVVSAEPKTLPAHFVPVETDIKDCVLLPVTEYDPDWEFGSYWIDGEETNAFGCYEYYNDKSDSWLILPQLKTDAGGTFNLSYKHVTRAAVNYTIYWGLEPTVEAMTNVIYKADGFSGTSPEDVSQDFDIPAGQNVYIGYHVTTERGYSGVNLKIFDINISASTVDYPEEPKFGITMKDLTATATVEFPAKTVSGKDITVESMTATIVIDGKTEYTLDGDAGAVVSKEFGVAAGEHTAVCTISYEEGGKTMSSKPVTVQFKAELPADFTLKLPLSFTPSAENYNMLSIIDANDDGKTWTVVDTYPTELRLSENAKLAADDWAILPAIDVKEAGRYKFTMQAAAQVASCPESVELCLGTSPTAEALDKAVIKLENFSELRNDDGTLPVYEALYTIDKPGIYYLGVHGFSQKDMLTVSVGTITMEKTRFDYLIPEEYAELPADMFTIDVTEACQDGIRFSVKAEEQIMIYTNAVFDERYITEDKLTDENFAEQLLYISNAALATFGSWEGAQKAEFFYFGDRNIENSIVNAAGTRAFVAVIGLKYDEATNTVTPLTKVCRSEVFVYTDDNFVQEEPWADMLDPVYIESKGKKVVHVDIKLNGTAEEAYGKGFAADHRDHNNDMEIIQYLTSYSNMTETLIFPMHLEVALEPGEKSLMCVATTDRNGKASKRLNWMLVEAPAEIGQPVKVLASATDQVGIGNIGAATDAPAVFFDLQGRSVNPDRLTPGVYIRRCGAETVKVVVR